LTTVYLVWGSTYLAIRVLVEEVPPILAAGGRFLAAALVLCTMIGLKSGLGRLRVRKKEALHAGLVSLLTLALAFALLFVAETEIPSGLAALLIASVPLWVVPLRLGAGDRPAPVVSGAVVFGFLGVGLLVGTAGSITGAPLVWIFVCLGAAAAEALGSFLAQRATLPKDALVSSTWQMLVAGSVLLLFSFASGEARDLHMADATSLESVLAFSYLVLPGSVLAYSAFVWLLQNATLSTATTYAYVNPIVALALGWLILDERITASMLVATTAIVGAVAVVIRFDRPQREVSAATELQIR
jgi:drug/metabolite transporter (DMT)-like permease